MNRRKAAAAIGIGLSFPATLWQHAITHQATPTASRRIVTIQSGAFSEQLAKSFLFGDVVLHHYRVVDNGDHGVLVLGAFLNTGQDAVDVPGLLDVVVRNRDDLILGSGFLLTDYPILPAGEKIGFQTWVSDVDYEEIDPQQVSIELSLGLQTENRQVARLAELQIAIESIEELSRTNQNLVIECVVTNASKTAFEHGITPYFSVWDSAGYYCGHAFENVMMSVPPGDSVRFVTHSFGSMINPLEISGTDFTWTPWIAPR